MRYTVTGKGGVLIGDLILSVGSASAALKQAARSREDFKCSVVVTDEKGHPVSALELENFADADTLAGAVASGLFTEYQLYFLTLAVLRRAPRRIRIAERQRSSRARQAVCGRLSPGVVVGDENGWAVRGPLLNHPERPPPQCRFPVRRLSLFATHARE